MNTINSAKEIFPITDFDKVKEKVLSWSTRFSTFCLLDNHHYPSSTNTLECILAAGVKRELLVSAGNALDQLALFTAEEGRWYFGHLGYDLKNETEKLYSAKPNHTGFADLYFFEPEIVIQLSTDQLVIEAEHPQQVYNDILLAVSTPPAQHIMPPVQSRISRETYIDIIHRLKQHILRGDCYEINFCQEFYATPAQIDPLTVYNQLSRASPNPFSAMYRVHNSWLLCASPERFFQKKGNRIISQPIKGTSRRELQDEQKDNISRQSLYLSAKDRSENVMVVDLVRNDLAKICEEGSVKVDELYGIYSFPQVHQMISTISGELKKDTTLAGIIKAIFPMGSMTGAPKKRVMELIETYEQSRRGIFSGAVGYVSPEGDMDFNVVIRSIMYNEATQYISFQAGSGITFYSDPQQEWEECLLKAAAIKMILENPG